VSREVRDGATLAQRLRGLRVSPQFGRLRQQQLAEALNISEALISSWEKGAAIPPQHRLQAYARFFATPRSVDDGKPRLLAEGDLLDDESKLMQALEEELFRLRDSALHDVDPGSREIGALGGRFWHFPDGARITIVCTRLSDRQLGLLPNGRLPEGASPIIGYSRPTHPNYIESLRNGDTDALTELVGHIRAENPTAEVRWTTLDRVEADELSGNLVLLGGDLNLGHVERGTFWWFIRRLELPIRVRLPTGGNEEFDMEFMVTTNQMGTPTYRGSEAEFYPPRFLRVESEPDRPRVVIDGCPQLEYDTALLVRKGNPINLSARIIICAGIFSRGTYGAVRLTTDATLRYRNELFLAENFDMDDFWLLFHVPVANGKTATPDLERRFLRLQHSGHLDEESPTHT
jgi:transcriptional regulator with XRE-family HTH domain